MSRSYDNWEKLVEAVLLREKLKQLAMADSISSVSDGSFRLSLIDQFIIYKWPTLQSPTVPDFDDASKWHRLSQPADHHYRPINSPLPRLQKQFSSMEFNAFFRSLKEVAELESVCWLDIRGKMKTRMMTSNTIYVLFNFNTFKCVESAKASVRFVDEETESEAEERAEIVHLQPVDRRRRKGEIAVERADGWMEVKIGNFYIDQGDEGEVEARFVETSCLKKGLIVLGIEFRPFAKETDVLELISWKMGQSVEDTDIKVHEARVVDEIDETEKSDQLKTKRITTKMMGLWNLIRGSES
ncbi:hypothetical protein BUALT_Bualt14G0040400 [Buddleja alternifolia]|uniref:F-box protein n=1 Tax=Buddleja alternifolia TaxID=168488 RepID=A0AAV6WQ30_9LAMI|nr:hypothetical protein BUALT_Bualt14G0040400 [Buddleja alternifolia]